ncbi:DUF488 domain-containing protein [Candidatus Pacearchaeota archaeon]|nr:DUF488 domain-containing protein [Candidatus Pacearchaeota archaeon]
MRLYTGCVDDGLMHRDQGLARYLTVSRLSDNSGRKPREDLWKGVKTPQGYTHLFDEWLPNIAPDGRHVNEWYHKLISWDEFSQKYMEKLDTEASKVKILEITRKVYEYERYKHPGIILQCVCNIKNYGDINPSRIPCHRIILAEKIRQMASILHNSDIQIIHL